MKTEVNERVRQHYLLEKKLARRILASSRENRTQVTIETYDELFSSIPWHPQLHNSAEKERKKLARKQRLFEHLFCPNSDILDIGAGTAYWTRYLANKSAGRCVGIDVSKQVLVGQPDDPPNLELYIMDAVELDFPANSFDIAISSQLVEHLHPDDVEHHFASVYSVLKENGVYAFDTPSSLNGPHDISKYFDDVAAGFHLKEWTFRELASRLKRVGFRRIRTMILPWCLAKRSSFFRSLGTVPVSLLIPGERLVKNIKHKRVRTALCKVFRVAPIYIMAQK
jgi:ubiquinone/menaquinone biosynthesis C-methylase UbiE